MQIERPKCVRVWREARSVVRPEGGGEEAWEKLWWQAESWAERREEVERPRRPGELRKRGSCVDRSSVVRLVTEVAPTPKRSAGRKRGAVGKLA